MSAHESERLSAWLDGELPPAERAEVDAHLAACAECRLRLADLGAVDGLAREQALEVPSGYFETFAGRVRARIEAGGQAIPTAPPARPRPSRWALPAWTWAAAAALILGVVTPLTVVRLGQDPTPVAGAPEGAVPAQTRLGTEAAAPAERDAPVTADDEAPASPRAKRESRDARELEERVAAGPRDAVAPSLAATPPPAAAPATAPLVGTAAGGAFVEALEEASEPSLPATRAPEPPTVANRPRSEAKDVAAFAAAPGHEDEAPGEVPRPAATAPRRQAARTDVAAAEASLDRDVAAPAKSGEATQQATGVREGSGRLDNKVSSGDLSAFARLDAETPTDAAGWREHREAWRTFVAAHPDSPGVDEARVRTIEAGIEAWRAGGDPADLRRAREDAEAYLARVDARQKDRVRAALEGAGDR